MAQTTKNIHQILNELDAAFGRKRLSTEVSHVANGHIYLSVTYAKNILITEENMWPKNKVFATVSDTKPGDRKDLRVMLKLWIKDTTPKDICGNSMQQPSYETVLWNDGVYINEYVMPDWTMAQQFYDTRRKMAGCEANLMAGSTRVALSGKLLHDATSSAEHMITTLSENLIKLMDGKTHMLSYTGGSTHREQLLNCQRGLEQAVRVYDCLKHDMPSGKEQSRKSA